MIGESGQEYRNKANEILEATKPHYGKFGNYIYECDVRPEDGAVIHSIATFGEHFQKDNLFLLIENKYEIESFYYIFGFNNFINGNAKLKNNSVL